MTTYLKIAREAARKAGYNPALLSLAHDGEHKLEYDGVKFGRKGYGDFIIYTLAEAKGEVPTGTAAKRRRSYLARSGNIRGDWEANPKSPNNLARKILW